MKLFASILIAGLFCATASAQTLKSLMYNTTNGQVVAATNLVWTNAFSFVSNSIAAQVRTNLGLGEYDDAKFNSVGTEGGFVLDFASGALYDSEPTNVIFSFGGTWHSPIGFINSTIAAITRTNLGLGSGITTNRTFVSYNGTNYTTNSVSISNGIITGWTQ